MIIGARSLHTLGVGEAAASPSFREVFHAQARFVWRSLLALGVGEADVPDASQHVFLVVHEKLDRLEPGCSVRTFVYGVCLRIASDFRRRAHVRRERPYAEPPEQVSPPTQEDRLSHVQALAALQGVLDRLDPAQRDVFVLYELEEIGMSDVARAVGCPLQTAYSRLHAARKAVVAAFETRENSELDSTRRQL